MFMQQFLILYDSLSKYYIRYSCIHFKSLFQARLETGRTGLQWHRMKCLMRYGRMRWANHPCRNLYILIQDVNRYLAQTERDGANLNNLDIGH